MGHQEVIGTLEVEMESKPELCKVEPRRGRRLYCALKIRGLKRLLLPEASVIFKARPSEQRLGSRGQVAVTQL